MCVNAGNYVGELGGFPNAYPASLTYYVLIFVKAVFVTPGLGHEAENSNGISSRAGCHLMPLWNFGTLSLPQKYLKVLKLQAVRLSALPQPQACMQHTCLTTNQAKVTTMESRTLRHAGATNPNAKSFMQNPDQRHKCRGASERSHFAARSLKELRCCGATKTSGGGCAYATST